MLGGIFGMLGSKRGNLVGGLGGSDVAAGGVSSQGAGSAYQMKDGGIDVMGTQEQTNKDLASMTTNPNAYHSRTGRPGYMNFGAF